jgi:diaminopimelate epimerase
MPGGDMSVRIENGRAFLTGSVSIAFEGTFEY